MFAPIFKIDNFVYLEIMPTHHFAHFLLEVIGSIWGLGNTLNGKLLNTDGGFLGRTCPLITTGS